MFGNIGEMMKQAKKMQDKMAEVQEKLATLEVEGTSGSGLVKATADGKGAIKGIKIDPTLLDPQEVDVLEDLIVAALRDVQAKAEELAAQEMGTVTGGLKLPGGMKLPF
ncbi:MAG TPA: YbaB/EbfC family nucleoid-associated protein [Alphaproteobacteria bacterium]|nr:YbaB/EbfC family nucleoid-associated protein [Alphaproteobacteria bacterium]